MEWITRTVDQCEQHYWSSVIDGLGGWNEASVQIEIQSKLPEATAKIVYSKQDLSEPGKDLGPSLR